MSALALPSPPRLTLEVPSRGERREPFSLTTSGENEIFTNQTPDEVYVFEVPMQAVGANTVQLRIGRGGRNQTPAWDLAQRDFLSDPGFVLRPGEVLILVLGGAGNVVGYVRWRKKADTLDG